MAEIYQDKAEYVIMPTAQKVIDGADFTVVERGSLTDALKTNAFQVYDDGYGGYLHLNIYDERLATDYRLLRFTLEFRLLGKLWI